MGPHSSWEPVIYFGLLCSLVSLPLLLMKQRSDDADDADDEEEGEGGRKKLEVNMMFPAPDLFFFSLFFFLISSPPRPTPSGQKCTVASGSIRRIYTHIYTYIDIYVNGLPGTNPGS